MTPTTRRPAALRLARLALLPAVIVLALPGVALAHADLVTSDPAEGAIVAPGSLATLTVTFSEALKDGSSLDLVGPGVGVASTARSTNELSMTMATPTSMPAGAWEIRWTSVAGDGDVLRGVVHFTVADASPALVTAAPTAARSPAPSTDGSGSALGGDAFIPVVVLGVVLVAGGSWFLRGRRPGPAA